VTHRVRPAAGATGGVDRTFFDAWANRLLAAWNNHDAAVLGELVTDDVTWLDPARPGPVQGVDAVRRFMEDSWRGMPDLHFEPAGPNCYAVNEPVVLTPWRMIGTHLGTLDPGFAPTGRRIDIEGVDRYTFRKDRLVAYRAYYDYGELARQLGLIPAPGSRVERAWVVLQRASIKLKRLLPSAARPHVSEGALSLSVADSVIQFPRLPRRAPAGSTRWLRFLPCVERR
jgi:steroid delta-isomerase-like uncharacterized protein